MINKLHSRFPFTARGGGGGSWGVMTSLIIQTNPWLPLEVGRTNEGGDSPLVCQGDTFSDPWSKFVLTFLLKPESIGVTEDESKACGSFRGDAFFCFGEGSRQSFIDAWAAWIEDNGLDPTLNECFENPFPVESWTSYGKFVSTVTDGLAQKFQIGREGEVLSFPLPSYLSTNEAKFNLLVPAKWYQDDIDQALVYPAAYLAFGGNVPSTSDGTDALSPAHR